MQLVVRWRVLFIYYCRQEWRQFIFTNLGWGKGIYLFVQNAIYLFDYFLNATWARLPATSAWIQTGSLDSFASPASQIILVHRVGREKKDWSTLNVWLTHAIGSTVVGFIFFDCRQEWRQFLFTNLGWGKGIDLFVQNAIYFFDYFLSATWARLSATSAWIQTVVAEVMVSIVDFQAVNPGSVLGRRMLCFSCTPSRSGVFFNQQI